MGTAEVVQVCRAARMDGPKKSALTPPALLGVAPRPATFHIKHPLKLVADKEPVRCRQTKDSLAVVLSEMVSATRRSVSSLKGAYTPCID